MVVAAPTPTVDQTTPHESAGALERMRDLADVVHVMNFSNVADWSILPKLRYSQSVRRE